MTNIKLLLNYKHNNKLHSFCIADGSQKFPEAFSNFFLNCKLKKVFKTSCFWLGLFKMKVKLCNNLRDYYNTRILIPAIDRPRKELPIVCRNWKYEVSKMPRIMCFIRCDVPTNPIQVWVSFFKLLGITPVSTDNS